MKLEFFFADYSQFTASNVVDYDASSKEIVYRAERNITDDVSKTEFVTVSMHDVRYIVVRPDVDCADTECVTIIPGSVTDFYITASSSELLRESTEDAIYLAEAERAKKKAVKNKEKLRAKKKAEWVKNNGETSKKPKAKKSKK